MHYGIAGQRAEARNLVLLINAGSLREGPAQRIVELVDGVVSGFHRAMRRSLGGDG